MVNKYRKKPVIVDALQWNGENIEAMREFVGKKGFYHVTNDNSLVIPTLEGDHKAMIGDFIIKGVAGEFYPCKPDIFKQTYEPVEGGDEWYCERCKQYVPGHEVTYDEYHDGCGGRCR